MRGVRAPIAQHHVGTRKKPSTVQLLLWSPEDRARDLENYLASAAPSDVSVNVTYVPHHAGPSMPLCESLCHLWSGPR